jgi:hypothetical protein
MGSRGVEMGQRLSGASGGGGDRGGATWGAKRWSKGQHEVR